MGEQGLAPLRGSQRRPFAICPACKAPLISTFHWAHKEFICLECGQLWEWLQPDSAEPTPDLIARFEALAAEWKQIGPYLITPRSWRNDCALCDAGEYHAEHTTADERAAHGAAMQRFRERVASSSPVPSEEQP